MSNIVSLSDAINPRQKYQAPFHYQAMNPNYLELINNKLERQHFMKHIGFDLTHIAPGYIEGFAPLTIDVQQQDGFIHGGMTATVSDLVTGFAAFSLVNSEDRVVTSDLKVSYFSPGKGEGIFARGWVIKPGARLMYCEAEVYSVEQERHLLIAKAYAIMAVIKGKNKEIEGT
ncbi:MAG: PaaI family thioesterase [Bacteroidota bacterium]|nr:PaaI family thioesterase [Bacteroidota bacterium]